MEPSRRDLVTRADRVPTEKEETFRQDIRLTGCKSARQTAEGVCLWVEGSWINWVKVHFGNN